MVHFSCVFKTQWYHDVTNLCSPVLLSIRLLLLWIYLFLHMPSAIRTSFAFEFENTFTNTIFAHFNFITTQKKKKKIEEEYINIWRRSARRTATPKNPINPKTNTIQIKYFPCRCLWQFTHKIYLRCKKIVLERTERETKEKKKSTYANKIKSKSKNKK